LYDAIKFEDKRKVQGVNLQLGSAECRAYKIIILEPNLQCQLDHLRQLHTLDRLEDGHDRSWECSKVLKYTKERTEDDGVDHRCLVEWNDLSKSQSWVNFFTLCLSNPKPIISFSREHKLLDKFPFFNLIPYRKLKMSFHVSQACNASSSLTTVEYKFGIQILREIRNDITLDKRSKNCLWQEAIESELKQITDYETFVLLHSGEGIPKGYQKIPYHIVFDVKYDLRHKAGLVAGGNWTVNEKEDIYSGVVRIDMIRIGFFLGELYGLSCCACVVGNTFLYGKSKEKVYITAGTESVSTLYGKVLNN
jgi:hypothetical protein